METAALVIAILGGITSLIGTLAALFVRVGKVLAVVEKGHEDLRLHGDRLDNHETRITVLEERKPRAA